MKSFKSKILKGWILLDKYMSNKNSFKVVLLGGIHVGKTSVVQRYVHNKFQEFYECTSGGSYFDRKLQIGEQNINLSIWDTAGQERYRSIVPMYYNNAHCVIIVFDLSSLDSLEVAKHWMKELIDRETNKYRVFLVGNKCDLYQEVDDSLIKKLIGDYDIVFMKVSAKTGENVDKLFQEIGQKLVNEYKEQIFDSEKIQITTTNNQNTSSCYC